MGSVSSRRLTAPLAVMAIALTSFGGCDAVNGIAKTLGFVPKGLTVIVDNGTRFAARPVIRTSNSRNGLEDQFTSSSRVTGFGDGGRVPANDSVTFNLSCSDLETIRVEGATFEDADGVEVGGSEGVVVLRRDIDFDCDKVLHITLTGSVFNFHSSVDVEQPTVEPTQINVNVQVDHRDIADVLDELYK